MRVLQACSCRSASNSSDCCKGPAPGLKLESLAIVSACNFSHSIVFTHVRTVGGTDYRVPYNVSRRPAPTATRARRVARTPRDRRVTPRFTRLTTTPRPPVREPSDAGRAHETAVRLPNRRAVTTRRHRCMDAALGTHHFA